MQGHLRPMRLVSRKLLYKSGLILGFGLAVLFVGILWDFRVEQIQDANRLMGTCSNKYSRDILDEVKNNRGNVNVRSDKGTTPLMDSAYYNNLDNIRLLILYGADLNAKDVNGKTAIDYASMNNNKMAEKLIRFFALRQR